MVTRIRFESDEAFTLAQELGIDLETEPFSLEDFREGLDAELAHRLDESAATDEDPAELGRVVLGRLRADPCYYLRMLEGRAAAVR